MATRSSVLAWRLPWTEEPGRIQSMGSQELDTAELPTPSHMQNGLSGVGRGGRVEAGSLADSHSGDKSFPLGSFEPWGRDFLVGEACPVGLIADKLGTWGPVRRLLLLCTLNTELSKDLSG